MMKLKRAPLKTYTCSTLFKYVWVYTTGFSMLLTLGTTAFAADKLSQSKQKLQQVQEEIGATSRKIEEKKATERSALQHLDDLDRNISRSDHQLQQKSEELEELKNKIAVTQKNSTHYETILRRARQDVVNRLKVLYTTGDVGALRLIFSDASPAVIAENTEFLQRITMHDKALMLHYRKEVENLEANRKKLEEQKKRYALTLIQQKEQRKKLTAAKREQAAIVSEIRHDSSKLENLLTDLKERSLAMKELVGSLEQQKNRVFIPTGGSFASLKGRLSWPSSGSVRSGFGVHKHEQFGSQVKTNGLEIVAMAGTQIKAIWQGKVVFAAPFKGYGNMLILDHGDKYYSLYANVAKLEYRKGDTVKSRDTIATAGLEGGDSYYFEIRHRGTPLNPIQWLTPRSY